MYNKKDRNLCSDADADDQFKAVIAVKLLQYVIANLNLKGSAFLCTLQLQPCTEIDMNISSRLGLLLIQI